jgi:hypothetical protein
MRPAALLAVAVVLASGCGGSAEEQADSATTEAAATDAPAPEPRADAPHPPASGSALGHLRSQEASGAPDERLTEAARAMLPTDIEVWCWDEGTWTEAERRIAAELGKDAVTYAGLADFYAHHIHLADWVCSDLETLAPGDDEENLFQSEALNVFAHEVRHFSPTGSLEHATECVALQRMDEVGVLLGASEEHAQHLKRLAWEEVYPEMPAEYRSPECRAGGVLDREPETPEFP